MHFLLRAGAAALAISLAAPVLAQEGEEPATDVIEVRRQLLTPSAGMMNDHMHNGGEIMLGLRFERERSSGANVSGSARLTDTQVLAAGYTVRARSMEMDMLMLDVMFAPTQDLTLMVMPHYMWHRMEMVGIDPANTGMMMGGMAMDHGHSGLPFGEVHAHGTKGFGDTLVSASYRLADQPGLSAHATLGLWLPTGDIDRTNADGTFVHYGMQPGSGTWDIEPVLTASGHQGAFGWGGQLSYRWRSESANSSGYALGDEARATAWLSYLLSSDVGAVARLEYEHEGRILGHYNGAHRHASPPDRQGNYGGDIVSAGLGVNVLLPVGNAQRPQLGVEFAVPVHQDLNGIQLPRDWSLSVSLAKTF